MNWLERNARWLAPIFFAAMVMPRFNSLLWSTSTVVSSPLTDMQTWFYSNRAFAFGQIAHGHLPLWNPYTYGGEPFLGNFQTAELYPPNWLLIVLPIGVGINWIVAFHVFAAGYFTYLWARGRGLRFGGAVLAGCVFMFCGPYFLHVFAGHLSHLSAMVWGPLLFWSLDGLARDGRARWAMLGAAAATMQILAGHPQYVYYTGIAATCYAAMLAVRSPHRRALLLGFVAIYLGAVGLSAVQLFPGLQAASESIRGGKGVDILFAGSLSFPPLNWITLIAPQWLGAVAGTRSAPSPLYWGFGYQWEASIFIGVTPAVLAALSLVETRRRHLWPLIGLAIVTAVLAMGRFTPIFSVLYHGLPGYDSFRGTSKFAYVTALCLAMLSGVGFDALWERRRALLVSAGVVAVIGAGLCVSAGAIRRSGGTPDSAWGRLLNQTAVAGQQSQELFFWSAKAYDEPAMIARTADRAAQSTLQAGVVMLLVAGLLIATRYRRPAAWLLLVTAVVELNVFANQSWATCPATPPAIPPAWQTAFDQQGDDRVLITDLGQCGYTMWNHREAVWGYDPNGLKRWAEFVFVTQNVSPDDVSQYLDFDRVEGAMFELMRCRFVLTLDPRRPVIPLRNPMRVAQLVGAARVIRDRDTMLRTMTMATFDPRKTVLLESAPDVSPTGAENPGTVKILRRTTDEMELQVDATSPAVLLVTDAYAAGWSVQAIGPSPQAEYHVMPADWAMRGVPLAAGSHHLLMSYRPISYRAGRWVTLLSLMAYLAVAGGLYRRDRSQQRQASAAGE